MKVLRYSTYIIIKDDKALGLDARKTVFGGLRTFVSAQSDKHLCYLLFGKESILSKLATSEISLF